MATVADLNMNNAVARLTMLAADAEVREKVLDVLARPGTRLWVHDGDEYLFSMQAVIRDEYPQLQFFVQGRLIEVRKMGAFSNQYSFCDFPPELLENRDTIEERFASVAVMTEDGMGWFAPLRWEDLSPDQQSMWRPKFVADNCRYYSL